MDFFQVLFTIQQLEEIPTGVFFFREVNCILSQNEISVEDSD